MAMGQRQAAQLHRLRHGLDAAARVAAPGRTSRSPATDRRSAQATAPQRAAPHIVDERAGRRRLQGRAARPARHARGRRRRRRRRARVGGGLPPTFRTSQSSSMPDVRKVPDERRLQRRHLPRQLLSDSPSSSPRVRPRLLRVSAIPFRSRPPPDLSIRLRAVLTERSRPLTVVPSRMGTLEADPDARRPNRHESRPASTRLRRLFRSSSRSRSAPQRRRRLCPQQPRLQTPSAAPLVVRRSPHRPRPPSTRSRSSTTRTRRASSTSPSSRRRAAARPAASPSAPRWITEATGRGNRLRDRLEGQHPHRRARRRQGHLIKVTFQDGSTAKATLVGSDKSTDTAVIHVDVSASQLHPLTLGNSSSVQPGQNVVAIGSPFGLAETMTAGIVSATNRTITAPNGFSITGAIQTDAAINHGNSGGPLIDVATNTVIGINDQIRATRTTTPASASPSRSTGRRASRRRSSRAAR